MTASSINFTFRSPQGDRSFLAHVSGITWGNMVDPTTGTFWSKVPAGRPAWTWLSGENNSFALMANYLASDTEATALSKLVVEPNAFEGGGHEIEVVLYTAAVDDDPGNIILRFWQVYVDGELQGADSKVARCDLWGSAKQQPASVFYPAPPTRS